MRGDSYAGYRAKLVETVRSKGVKDLAVLKAIAEVPRHLFVPDAMLRSAYDDNALPIGHGQTISQPSTQALSIQALKLTGHEKVLEIGTGSGYQTALLAAIVEQVFSIERMPVLHEQARQALMKVGANNVSLLMGDGTIGWRAYAPYDAIIIAAASPDVPKPLIEQLANGGRLVIPIGPKGHQMLTLVTKDQAGQVKRSNLADVIFVPLLGQHGFEN